MEPDVSAISVCLHCGRKHIRNDLDQVKEMKSDGTSTPKDICIVSRIIAEEDFVDIVEDFRNN